MIPRIDGKAVIAAICLLFGIVAYGYAQGTAAHPARPDISPSANVNDQPDQKTTILSEAETRRWFGFGRPLSKKDEQKIQVWTPTDADIRQLETDLPTFATFVLSHPPTDYPHLKVDIASYYRQYMGIVDGGQKLILINSTLR